MARYISATVTHPDGRIPGDELTLITEPLGDIIEAEERGKIIAFEDEIVGIGKEAADALLSHVEPNVRRVVLSILQRGPKGEITQNSRQHTGKLTRDIKGRSSTDVGRNLQRWANWAGATGGQARKPTLATVEKYQLMYEQNTGRRSRDLDRLARALQGIAEPEDLASGTLNIIIKGWIAAYVGSDDVRNRPVKIDIKPEKRALRLRAFDDPIAIWLEVFRESTEVILLSCDWLFMEYVEA